MATENELPPFDLRLAMDTLAAKDPHLAPLIQETQEFRVTKGAAESPYEVLVEAITHQSISGRAAATIFGRVKALGSNGRIPTPQEMLKLRKPALRKAGLSAAKILAMKDLAQKTIDGVVPTLDQARRLSDEELVNRLVSVRGIGAWTVEMFLIFRLGRPDVLSRTRPRRPQGLGHHLRQKAHACAQRTPEIWRTLAAVPHGRLLVHVARLPTRRPGRLAQDPPPQNQGPRQASPCSLRKTLRACLLDPSLSPNAPLVSRCRSGFSPSHFWPRLGFDRAHPNR